MSRFLNAFAFLDEYAKLETLDERVQERYYDILGDISIAIVNYREKHGMNQQDLAAYMNVTQPMIVKYERGTHNFTLKTLNDICGKLGLDLNVKITEPMSTKGTVIDKANEDMVDAA